MLAHGLTAKFPEANFYLFPTRAWELIAGALLAKLERDYGRSTNSMLQTVMPLLGLACLCFAFAQFDGRTRHPGFATMVPFAATMALIWFTGERDLVTKLLTRRILVGLGLISYSLYLWHQPLFSFARIYAVNKVPQAAYCGLALIAVVLAYFSWRFVEQPFRRPNVVPRRVALSVSAAGLITIVVVSVAGQLSGRFPQRMPVLQAVGKVTVGYKTLSGDLCTRENCIVGDEGERPSIVVVGDSHAGILAQSVEKALKGTGKAALILANGREKRPATPHP